MLEFTEFKQNAKQLTEHLMYCQARSFGCISFFSPLIPIGSAIDDSLTIGMIAKSFNEENDVALLDYIKNITRFSAVSGKDLEVFKCKVLTGIYLIMWSHYNSTISSYLNNSLISMFQRDLGVSSPQELEETLYQSSLEALSQYCSFIYENRRLQLLYEDINNRLGSTIQADIVNIRNTNNTKEASWYDVCSGIFST